MAENELPNQGDTIDQDGSFGVGVNKGNVHSQTVAGTVKLLSREQICNYLDSLGADLIGLRKLVAEDKVWQGLAESPLMLNIMALAYRGLDIEDFPKTDSLEERRKKLFNDYIEQVLKRRKANQLYTNKQVIHWLFWLAQKIFQESQTVFLIEKMQPHWLENSKGC